MKTRLLTLVAASCLALVAAAHAQAPKSGKTAPAPRSPADLARDEFNKARNEQGGKFDPARFQRVIAPGIAFLQQYPTNTNANAVIRDIVGWPDTVKLDRKTQAPQRIAYMSHLRFVVLGERFKDDLSEDAKAAMAALEVALSDAELREQPTRQAVTDLRTKLDALAKNPRAGRFLAEREMSYVQILNALQGPAQGEEHLQALSKHKEKSVADRAKTELSLMDLRREPVNWKITGIDGKAFDFAQHRGKIIAVYFWSTASSTSTRNLEMLRQVHSSYRRRGLEVVTVSYDKEEDRAKLEKFIKDNRVAFPVYFDGKGSRNEFGSRLNYTSVPRLALFDQKGVLAFHDLNANQLEGAVKRLLEPPAKKKS
jgi:peroxiredoxin